MNPAEMIAAAIDRHLKGATEMVVFGSGALLLDRSLAEFFSGRMTNDIDIIIPASRELAVDADAEFWAAITAVNRELEPEGFYVSHIFPEREIVLSAQWEARREAVAGPWRNLRVTRPRMLDLILSKMGRGDVQDVADVRAMLRGERASGREPITAGTLERAAAEARVPDVYREIFPRARDAILAAAREEDRADLIPEMRSRPRDR
jgi:hypothetical protein